MSEYHEESIQCRCLTFACTQENFLNPIEEKYGLSFSGIEEIMAFCAENNVHHPACPEYGIMTPTGDVIVICPNCRQSTDISNAEMLEQSTEALSRETLALSIREMEEEFYKCSWCGRQETWCTCYMDDIFCDDEED